MFETFLALVHHANICNHGIRFFRRILHLEKLERRHKNVIHGIVLTFITVALIRDGAKLADTGFLALSVLCEVPDVPEV